MEKSQKDIFLVVKVYAKSFMSCNLNYYSTQKLRESVAYDESEF